MRRIDNEKDAGMISSELLLAGFKIGGATFGIDARLVLEVVKVGEVTLVHGAPPGVSGIRNLRGRIVTVVDMAAHLGLGCIEIGPHSRLMIIEHQSEPFGFLVDAVTETLAIDTKGIDSPPTGMDPNLRNHLSGVWREAGQLVAVIDPEAMFRWREE